MDNGASNTSDQLLLQSSGEKDKSSGGGGGTGVIVEGQSEARKMLKEAATNLRHEKLILKESLLRLQLEKEDIRKEFAAESKSVLSPGEYANVYRPPALAQQQQIPIMYVAAAIALAIFGFILGKFVL